MDEEASDAPQVPPSPRPPLPPGSTDKLRATGYEGAASSGGDRSNGRRASDGLIPIHVVKTGTPSKDTTSTEEGANSREQSSSRPQQVSSSDALRSGEAGEGSVHSGIGPSLSEGNPDSRSSTDDNIASRFPRGSSMDSRDLALPTPSGSSRLNSESRPESEGTLRTLLNNGEDGISENPMQDSSLLARISKGKEKMELPIAGSSVELTDISLSMTGLSCLHNRGGSSFVPLRSLRGWPRLRRVAFHYVRFHMAIAKLRDMHVHWELDPGLLKKMEVLGEGCFAVCYRCQTIDGYGNKRELALKLLNHGSSDQDVDDFIRERDLMRKLRHTAIVEYHASGNIQLDAMHFPEMYLAMECMKGGSVRNMILKQMDSPHRKIYTKLDALRWLTDVAKGLKYLHSRSPCVIHRDLKPENIMLTSSVASQASAKVADFGLHSLVDREGTDPEDVYQLTGNTGSLMYMSPEVFRLEPYNEKADVFSFAVNFWELFNCSLMIARITNMGTQEEVYNYACGVANGIRPRIPESWPFSVVSLVTDCWDPFPSNRPDFNEIVQRLEACKEDVRNMDGVKGGGGGGAECCCTVQ